MSKQLVYILVTVTVWTLAVGCGRPKCQSPPEQPFQTFTETQWRLVETNDPNPGFSKLSLTHFQIYTFKRNYTGDIKIVKNNDLYPTPVATFIYDVDPDGKRVRLEITENSVEIVPGENGEQTPKAAGKSYVLDFGYALRRDFVLTGTYNGFRYRFVPFTGAVDPDRVCEF